MGMRAAKKTKPIVEDPVVQTEDLGQHAPGPHLAVAGSTDLTEPPLSLQRRSQHQTGLSRVGIKPPPVFPDVPSMVADYAPDHPVLCVRPDEIKRLASVFTQGFGGTPLYAVKCNPDPFVLSTLFQAGITSFDVASIQEVHLIDALFGDLAGLFFNNPAKSREAVRVSSANYGVRFYTIDHASELDKLIEETRGVTDNIVAAVRVAVHAEASRYALSTKFGAPPELASTLLRMARGAGLRVGVSFHVGSQCLDPGAFGQAMRICRDVVRGAGTTLDLLNVGGGFPAPYPGDQPADLGQYFQAAELGRRALGLSPKCLVLCEPGRALVGTAASVVMQVMLRKDNVIYCNDGIYGNLQELRSPKENRPARLIRSNGETSTGAEPFKVYGPTCDSDDVLGAPLRLPADVREGDWIEIGMMGAYSSATRTPFNGFFDHSMIQVPG